MTEYDKEAMKMKSLESRMWVSKNLLKNRIGETIDLQKDPSPSGWATKELIRLLEATIPDEFLTKSQMERRKNQIK